MLTVAEQEPARSGRRDASKIPVRPRVVRAGAATYPHVGDITRAGVEFWHKGTHQGLPVPWRQLIEGGAELYDMTPAEFLAFLERILHDKTSAPSGQPGNPEHGRQRA